MHRHHVSRVQIVCLFQSSSLLILFKSRISSFFLSCIISFHLYLLHTLTAIKVKSTSMGYNTEIKQDYGCWEVSATDPVPF